MKLLVVASRVQQLEPYIHCFTTYLLSTYVTTGKKKVIVGSREEQLEREREKLGASVSNRLPFKCDRCNWSVCS